MHACAIRLAYQTVSTILALAHATNVSNFGPQDVGTNISSTLVLMQLCCCILVSVSLLEIISILTASFSGEANQD